MPLCMQPMPLRIDDVPRKAVPDQARLRSDFRSIEQHKQMPEMMSFIEKNIVQ